MNYGAYLRAAHERHLTDDPPAPQSWLDYKNARALDAWRRRLSALPQKQAPTQTPFRRLAAAALSKLAVLTSRGEPAD